MYGTGISKVGEIVDLGAKFGIINKSGAWFSYGETRLGQGRDNVKLLLPKEKALAEEIEGKIRLKLAGKDEQQEEQKDETPVITPIAPRRSAAGARAKIDIAVDDD